VIFVEGNLALSGGFAGKAVIVVTGSVTLTNVTVQDPSHNQLTVLAFGSISVKGPRCDVAVMAGDGAAFTADGTPEYRGQLVFAGELGDSTQLKGRLTRNRYMFSGNSEDNPRTEHYLVLFSPQLRGRTVVRR
jgi:hypothetical protein